MTRIVLGVDAGGTTTVATIADERGRVLGTGTGGPGNIDDVGADRARDNISAAVTAAREVASFNLDSFDAAFLGMAGVVSAADRALVAAAAAPLELAPTGHLGIDHDCRVALAGALSGRPGIVLIAGTGSSCYGRTSVGTDWRTGGWGSLAGDESSSHWLGVEAIRAAVRDTDGRGPTTSLTGAVFSALGLSEPDDLLHRLHVAGTSRLDIAALAPLVTKAARAGDSVAAALLDHAAGELGDMIEAVAIRLDLDEVGLVGGLFGAGAVVVDRLNAVIDARLLNVRITLAERCPSLGAALLAIESLDLPLYPDPEGDAP